MKNFVAAFLCLAVLVLFAVPVEAAIFRGGNRTNIVAVNGGGFNVNVVNQQRGLFRGRSNTKVFVNNGFNSNAVFVNNRRARNNAVFVNNGFHNNNAVFVNNAHVRNNAVVVNNGFRRNNVVAVNVNGQHFNSFNNANRVNVFGTRTFVSNGGNVFEVDAFGNTRVRGSAFRGFGTNGVVVNTVNPAFVNSSFVSTNFVDNGFNANAFTTFDTGGHNPVAQVAVFRGFSSGCH